MMTTGLLDQIGGLIGTITAIGAFVATLMALIYHFFFREKVAKQIEPTKQELTTLEKSVTAKLAEFEKSLVEEDQSIKLINQKIEQLQSSINNIAQNLEKHSVAERALSERVLELEVIQGYRHERFRT